MKEETQENEVTKVTLSAADAAAIRAMTYEPKLATAVSQVLRRAVAEWNAANAAGKTF